MGKKIKKLPTKKTKTAIKEEKIGIATQALKENIIEFLTDIPIAKYAYGKAGVPKATYYKWRKTDSEFLQQTDAAIFEGRTSINDLAKSQLIKKIQNGETTPIIFWLKHNDPDFNPRVSLDIKGPLISKEQALEIARAMRHIGLKGVIESEKVLFEKFKKSSADPIDLIINRENWAGEYRKYKEETAMKKTKQPDSEK